MNLAPKVLNPRINEHLNFWCVSLHCCMLVVCLLPLQVKRLSAQAGKKTGKTQNIAKTSQFGIKKTLKLCSSELFT